jgi:hypothetical protein
MVGTIFLALYLKNGIIQRVRDTPNVSGISDGIRLDSFDRQIKAKEQSIEFEKQMPDWEKIERESKEKLSKASNKKFEANNTSNVGESKADKIKKLEDEKAKLIAEKNEFEGQMRAKQMKPLTWNEWFEVYNIELLVVAVIPLGIFSLYLLRFIFGRRLPNNNPFSLSEFERKSVLFIAFSIVFSAFGFFVFLWFLSVYY